jgi:glyoxylase-like metal-dependent hydrolase (beta-lactamase superfamily II)
VISYLIIGNKKALLFDTGLGLDSIQVVVRQLTSLPVTVINSHTHFDHIGGNADFTNILGVDTAYTLTNAQGWSHESIKQEVTPAAFCPETLSSIDTASNHIRPYSIACFIRDGSVLDLGGRQIEVIMIPGHTPDGVALLDRDAGLLWTGDTYYEGPLWLFFPGTDLDAFEKSISRMAALTPNLKHLLPAHNLPLIPPGRLLEVKEAIAAVRAGQGKGELVTDGGTLMKDVVRFKFGHFSFLIRKDLLP